MTFSSLFQKGDRRSHVVVVVVVVVVAGISPA
jgi:hypothetical protein